MSEVRDRLRVLDGVEAPEQWREIEQRHPRGSVRVDRALGGRVAAALVAVAVATGGTLLTVDRLSPSPELGASLDTATWRQHEVPSLGLSFRYPPEWHVQPFDELVGHATFAGALVSNVEHTFRHPDLGPHEVTTAWALRDLPDDGVAISIERADAIALPRATRDTPLPLSLGRGRVVDSYRPGPDWMHRWLPFVLDGRHDSVRVWFGPETSEQDREVARLIVATIAPLDPPSFDGWTVLVSVENGSSGHLEVAVGSARRAEPNDAEPWIQHTIVLRNSGDVALHFNPPGQGEALGTPEPVLLAAEEGCSFTRVGRSSEREWQAGCLLSRTAFVVPPQGVARRTITLWKDRRGLEPLREGAYGFDFTYRFGVGDWTGEHRAPVRIVYTIDRAA